MDWVQRGRSAARLLGMLLVRGGWWDGREEICEDGVSNWRGGARRQEKGWQEVTARTTWRATPLRGPFLWLLHSKFIASQGHPLLLKCSVNEVIATFYSSLLNRIQRRREFSKLCVIRILLSFLFSQSVLICLRSYKYYTASLRNLFKYFQIS